MRSFRNQLRWCGRIGLLMVFLAFATNAQIRTAPGRRGPLTGDDNEPPDITAMQMERKQQQMANEQRQKHLVSDTDKLLRLADELRSDANAPGKTTASADLARKANEIEKLAHGIRSKMAIAP
jgi:hypothetical protein